MHNEWISSINWCATYENHRLIDRAIDSTSSSTTIFNAIGLALGNSADAAEILCVGYIMNKISEATTQQKDI